MTKSKNYAKLKIFFLNPPKFIHICKTIHHIMLMDMFKLSQSIFSSFENGNFELVLQNLLMSTSNKLLQKDCRILLSRLNRLERNRSMNQLPLLEAEQMMCTLSNDVYYLIEKVLEE